ncbi:MAG: DNA methyltransferase [Kiritimatiellia bacterium]
MTSWNEIRKAATAFSKRWRSAHDEKSQAQSFLKEFFNVFGVDAVAVATFEHRVKFADGSQGYVDCFWQGKILVEMKSRGRDLDAAYRQAMDYVRSLPNIAETPRAIVVSDFARIRFYDLSRDCALTEFPLKDLRKYVTLFGYLIGSDGSEEIREQNPVNRKAAEKMAALHDAMKAVGYEGHPLEVYLVRLLFCLFAEDTGIFKPGQFSHFIKTRTAEDGSDLAPQLALLFDTLNREKRLVNLDETIAAFPYVNGGLFADTLPFAAFSSEMRQALLACAALDWSKISPAIFGAMFQGVMDEKARHDLGAHYTSEENILKLIRPLFLDGLRAEFDALCALKSNAKRSRLQAFHDKIAALAFLDPACGCGNFLLIAYRELRRLEMDVLEELHKDDPALHLDISVLCQVSVAQFHGIEIEPFPAEIAKVALWLMDHLCNMEVADRFGQYFIRIPIKDAPHILCANALTMDWGSLLAAKGKQHGFDYIMGNPPFLGFTWMSPTQKADMLALFPKNRNLDFVCGWYKKANDLIEGTPTRCAFVSTNSITQGEQVAPLWSNLNAEIDFAYRTFKWHNEAKGNAAVHCVIIGFHSKSPVASAKDAERTIYESDGTAIPAKHINAYLVDGPDAIVESRNKSLCDVPQMVYGNKPVDGGNLIIDANEYEAFIAAEPLSVKYVKRLIGAKEFLHNIPRYCLWLKDAAPSDIAKMPLVRERIMRCREMRLSSRDAGARKLAMTPGLFRETNNPPTAIIVPSVTSERREYIPIGFIDDSVIVSNLALFIPNATRYHFGVLTSRMHNAWMRAVAGRLKSDYRYSKDIVYNNFVWPDLEGATTKKGKIEEAAQAVLDARAAHPKATLADLYDPLTMPPDLVKAHAHLDALVDKAYGLSPSATDAERVALLFKLYAKRVALTK